MDTIDYSKMVSYAMIYHQQIRKIKEESNGRNWEWEIYLPEPISTEEAELIMGIAGCWCDDPSEGSRRFYTNQNHPSWSNEKP